MGKIIDIFISEDANKLPVHVDVAEMVKHRGLTGDRYYHKTGTYSDVEPKSPGRDLTLIELEVLEQLELDHSITLSGAEARRNIVTQGISLNKLVGKRFRIGAVICEGIRLCHPCQLLEKLTGKKVLRPLVDLGGLRADILTNGTIRVGDSIIVGD
jgi:MOSC domain-containing protein YiiM